MADTLDWMEARRLARYVRDAGRTGLHRTDADGLMGGTVGARRTAFGLAYSRRWIDVCGPWLVLPANRQRQQTAGDRDAPPPARHEQPELQLAASGRSGGRQRR